MFFFLVKSRLQRLGHVIYFHKQKVIHKMAIDFTQNWSEVVILSENSCHLKKIALATVIFFSDISEQVC